MNCTIQTKRPERFRLIERSQIQAWKNFAGPVTGDLICVLTSSALRQESVMDRIGRQPKAQREQQLPTRKSCARSRSHLKVRGLVREPRGNHRLGLRVGQWQRVEPPLAAGRGQTCEARLHESLSIIWNDEHGDGCPVALAHEQCAGSREVKPTTPLPLPG
jgi:hypothetical protein